MKGTSIITKSPELIIIQFCREIFLQITLPMNGNNLEILLNHVYINLYLMYTI